MDVKKVRMDVLQMKMVSFGLSFYIEGHRKPPTADVYEVFNSIQLCHDVVDEESPSRLRDALQSIDENGFAPSITQCYVNAYNLVGTPLDQRLLKHHQYIDYCFNKASVLGNALVECLNAYATVHVLLTGSTLQGTVDNRNVDCDYIAVVTSPCTQLLTHWRAILRDAFQAERAHAIPARSLVRLQNGVYNGMPFYQMDVSFKYDTSAHEFGRDVWALPARTRLLIADIKSVLKAAGFINPADNFLSSAAVVVAVMCYEADVRNGLTQPTSAEMFNSFCTWFSQFDFDRYGMHSQHGTIPKPENDDHSAVINEHVGGFNVADRLFALNRDIIQCYLGVFGRLHHFDYMISHH